MSFLQELLAEAEQRFVLINEPECRDREAQATEQGKINACNECLRKIHYTSSGQQVYRCEKMIHLYMLRYLYSYATEVYDTVKRRLKVGSYDGFKIVSIGCGSAPDLCAIRDYIETREISTNGFSYYGIEPNPLWKPYHDMVAARYSFAKFSADSILDLSEQSKKDVMNCNLLSLQYFLSAVNDKSNPSLIEDYFKAICDAIVKYMPRGGIILINDTNSDYMGRPKWDAFYSMVKVTHPNAKCEKYSYYKKGFVEYGTTICKQKLFSNIFSAPEPVPNYLLTDPENKAKYDTQLICRSSQMIIRL